MKKIRIETIKVILLLGVLQVLWACNTPNIRDGVQENIIPTDTIFVAADSSQRAVLNSLVEVYEALNPTRKVIPIYSRERKLYDYIKNDKVDLIIRSYLITELEQKDIDKRKLIPKIHSLWADGVALIASNEFAKDSIGEQELSEVLLNRSTAFHVIVDNSSTATYELVFNKYASNKTSVKAYAAGSEDSVINAVKNNLNYIGLIGSSYFTKQVQKLPEGIKLLGLVPMSRSKAEYPFQDQLYNEVYPLKREIYGINVGAKDGSGTAFASFILSERGQRIILKAGLLPAKIPPRTIELVSE